MGEQQVGSHSELSTDSAAQAEMRKIQSTDALDWPASSFTRPCEGFDATPREELDSLVTANNGLSIDTRFKAGLDAEQLRADEDLFVTLEADSFDNDGVVQANPRTKEYMMFFDNSSQPQIDPLLLAESQRSLSTALNHSAKAYRGPTAKESSTADNMNFNPFAASGSTSTPLSLQGAYSQANSNPPTALGAPIAPPTQHVCRMTNSPAPCKVVRRPFFFRPVTEFESKGQPSGLHEEPAGGYPLITTDLDPNISLEDQCWRFPNHLGGKRLYRFIEANWSARDILYHCPQNVQDMAPPNQPWSKLQHRLGLARQEYAVYQEAQRLGTDEEFEKAKLSGSMAFYWAKYPEQKKGTKRAAESETQDGTDGNHPEGSRPQAKRRRTASAVTKQNPFTINVPQNAGSVPSNILDPLLNQDSAMNASTTLGTNANAQLAASTTLTSTAYNPNQKLELVKQIEQAIVREADRIQFSMRQLVALEDQWAGMANDDRTLRSEVRDRFFDMFLRWLTPERVRLELHVPNSRFAVPENRRVTFGIFHWQVSLLQQAHAFEVAVNNGRNFATPTSPDDLDGRVLVNRFVLGSFVTWREYLSNAYDTYCEEQRQAYQEGREDLPNLPVLALPPPFA